VLVARQNATLTTPEVHMTRVDSVVRLDHFFRDVVSGLPPAKFYTMHRGGEEVEIENEALAPVQLDQNYSLLNAYWFASPRHALACQNRCFDVPHSVRLEADYESGGLRIEKQDSDCHSTMSLQYEYLGLSGMMVAPDHSIAVTVPNGALAARLLVPWINAMYGNGYN